MVNNNKSVNIHIFLIVPPSFLVVWPQINCAGSLSLLLEHYRLSRPSKQLF